MLKSALLFIGTLASAGSCGDALAASRDLEFSGLTGASTAKDVRRIFPDAVEESLCRSDGKKIQNSADGPYLCDYLRLDKYPLFGYEFGVSFWFYPSGRLKGISLSWPDAEISAETSDTAISTAYFVALRQFGTKYGPKVERPPCEIIGNSCAEWQMDGSTKWSATGERIEIEMENKLRVLRGLTIKYQFADRSAFDRF